MQAVAARPGLVGKHQRRRFRPESPNQFVEVRLACADRPNTHGRISALPLRVGDGDRIFVDVQADEKRCRLCHG
jgi:hypothetical protein